MSMNLSNLRKVRATKPPRILAYGPPGIGKTTLASEFEAPVFLQIEDGTPAGLELDSFGEIFTFGEVMSAMQSLYEGEHDFKTVIVDSVTRMEKLVFAETCRRGDDKGNAKSNIEDFGYGKGYIYAKKIWQEFVDGLNCLRNDRGMTVILIAHSAIENFNDPETESYDRYKIDLHKHSIGLIEQEMDAILLLKKPVTIKTEDGGFNKERTRAEAANVIMIHTSGKPAYTAKNRYDMPSEIRYDKGKGYEALSKYFPQQEQPAQKEQDANKKDAA